jgi:hypothetical protein
MDSIEERRIYNMGMAIEFVKSRNWIFFRNGNKHFAWLNARIPKKIKQYDPVKADIIIAGRLTKREELQRTGHFNATMLVFDSSCKPSLVKVKSDSLIEAKIETYDVRVSGALVYHE